jgi:hypothetical protein
MKGSQGIVASVEETESKVQVGKPQRPKRLLSPSLLSKKLLCPGVVSKPYMQESKELRQQFSVLTRMSIIRTIMSLTRKGYRFIQDETPSGQFTGAVDLVFESPDGQPTKVEVKSSKFLKPLQIVQSILYHESGDKILVASLNEILEPSDWLIEPVKSVAAELNQFLQEYPEQASHIYVPHRDLCERCISSECSRRMRTVQRDHHR